MLGELSAPKENQGQRPMEDNLPRIPTAGSLRELRRQRDARKHLPTSPFAGLSGNLAPFLSTAL